MAHSLPLVHVVVLVMYQPLFCNRVIVETIARSMRIAKVILISGYAKNVEHSYTAHNICKFLCGQTNKRNAIRCENGAWSKRSDTHCRVALFIFVRCGITGNINVWRYYANTLISHSAFKSWCSPCISQLDLAAMWLRVFFRTYRGPRGAYPGALFKVRHFLDMIQLCLHYIKLSIHHKYLQAVENRRQSSGKCCGAREHRYHLVGYCGLSPCLLESSPHGYAEIVLFSISIVGLAVGVFGILTLFTFIFCPKITSWKWWLFAFVMPAIIYLVICHIALTQWLASVCPQGEHSSSHYPCDRITARVSTDVIGS